MPTITITSPPANPEPNQYNRIALDARPADNAAGTSWTILLTVFHAASARGVSHSVTVRNGASDVIKRNANATTLADLIVVVAGGVTTATGYDQVAAIVDGAGGRNAKLTSLLTLLQTLGVIDASLAGT